MNYNDYNANRTRRPGTVSTASWQVLPVRPPVTSMAERIRRAIARIKESPCKSR